MTRISMTMVAILAFALGVQSMELSEQQETTLLTLGDEFAQKSFEVDAKIGATVTALETELMREGRLDSKKAAAASSKQVNAIVKKIGKLAGQTVQLQVEFLLKAKNVLTVDQKLHLLGQLEDAAIPTGDEILFLETEILELPIDLSLAQRKTLVKMAADLECKDILAERDAELILMDLEAAFLVETVDPETVDKLMVQLGDLAGRVVNFRVDAFLKAKDVLTLEQKQILACLLGLG